MGRTQSGLEGLERRAGRHVRRSPQVGSTGMTLGAEPVSPGEAPPARSPLESEGQFLWGKKCLELWSETGGIAGT